MDHKEGLIVGRNAVLQALESGRTIDSVTVAQGQRGGQAGRIIDICRERKIPVKFADQRRLDRLCDGAAHQGVALGGASGSALETIILASSVLYELIGPGCAKLALYLSRSYSTKLEDVAVVAEVTETGEQKSDVQLLIERIRKIQSELPPLESDVSEEEAAFTEAAEEQLAQTQAQRRYFYLRR